LAPEQTGSGLSRRTCAGRRRRTLSRVALVVASLGVGVSSSYAEQGIGGAEIVINNVTGALVSGRDIHVAQGDNVFRDEAVRTAADSSAKLVLRDNTNLSLGPSSSITLDRFVYGGAGRRGAIAVNLVKGALRFATGDADKQAYKITTPTATLGVRGTILKIDATAAKTIVFLEEGAVIVCTRRAGRHCIELTAPGQTAVVTVTQVGLEAPASPGETGGVNTGRLGVSPGPSAAPPGPAPSPSGPSNSGPGKGNPGNGGGSTGHGDGDGDGDGDGGGNGNGNGHGHASGNGPGHGHGGGNGH
jgi:hypothetical protein